MKLAQTELIPGVVIDAKDPLRLGRVKANVAGVFQTDDPSTVPWIAPLFRAGSNSFSAPKNGDKIWLWLDRSSGFEFWYSLQPDFAPIADIAEDYTNAEVLMSRETVTGQSSRVYASDKAGMVFEAEKSSMRMRPSGEIAIDAANGKSVALKDSCVSIGESSGDFEGAVLGEKLKSLLNGIATDLTAAATAASGCPFTAHLSAPLNTAANNIRSAVDAILSENVKLN